MRGSVSAGMLIALDQLGFRDAFDLVVGTSAGAIAASFFVTGRGSAAVAMYYDELNSEPFLSRKRMIRRGPVLDVDYLIDDAAPRRGLSFEAVANSDIPVYATVTPVEPDNETTLLRLNGSSERVAAILQATASLPVMAGDSKEVDGQLYVDGGLTEQIPWRSASGLDTTHMLVAPSRVVSGTELRSAQNFLERVAVPRIVRNMHGQRIADITRTLPARATAESWSLREAVEGRASPLTPSFTEWTGHMEMIEVNPELELPTRLETSQQTLIDAVIGGAQCTVDHFGLGDVEVQHAVVLAHPAADPVDYASAPLAEIIRSDASGRNARH